MRQNRISGRHRHHVPFLCFSFTEEDEQVGARSLYFDVTGEIRKDRVKLPVSILSSKPGALPNTEVSTERVGVVMCVWG